MGGAKGDCLDRVRLRLLGAEYLFSQESAPDCAAVLTVVVLVLWRSFADGGSSRSCSAVNGKFESCE